jgi:Arc/MetJ-type ribon-helix-helix transcriptional regulator
MTILLNSDLENRITAKVESGRYRSPAEVVAEGLDLLEARDAAAQEHDCNSQPAIWETIIGLGQQVPEDEWAQVPSDLAQNVDHYLYGSSKASE